VEVDCHGARPRLEKRKVGELEWWNLDAEIREAGDLRRLVKTIKQRRNPCTTLVKLQLGGVLFADEVGILEELPDLLLERFLYGQVDDSALNPARGRRFLDKQPAGR
jgi:hypothetical protein